MWPLANYVLMKKYHKTIKQGNRDQAILTLIFKKKNNLLSEVGCDDQCFSCENVRKSQLCVVRVYNAVKM